MDAKHYKEILCLVKNSLERIKDLAEKLEDINSSEVAFELGIVFAEISSIEDIIEND